LNLTTIEKTELIVLTEKYKKRERNFLKKLAVEYVIMAAKGM